MIFVLGSILTYHCTVLSQSQTFCIFKMYSVLFQTQPTLFPSLKHRKTQQVFDQFKYKQKGFILPLPALMSPTREVSQFRPVLKLRFRTPQSQLKKSLHYFCKDELLRRALLRRTSLLTPCNAHPPGGCIFSRSRHYLQPPSVQAIWSSAKSQLCSW